LPKARAKVRKISRMVPEPALTKSLAAATAPEIAPTVAKGSNVLRRVARRIQDTSTTGTMPSRM